jgi:hypothetical protein
LLGHGIEFSKDEPDADRIAHVEHQLAPLAQQPAGSALSGS